MSFVLEIEVADLTEDQARAIETECEIRSVWPIRVHRSGLFRKRLLLTAPDRMGDTHLLTDEADWDAPSWDMTPDLLPKLAGAIRVLDEHLPQGYAFRATWVNDPVKERVELSAAELADLILGSQLNQYTLYRVRGRSSQ